MTWNYRLCKTTHVHDDIDEVVYGIREAYYNKNGDIWAVTENAAGICGETIEEAQQCLELMKLAFSIEVIDLDTFVFANSDFDR